jgi:hypothetical protein
VILALDPGTQTGWAAGKAGGSPEWGSRKFEGKSTGQVIGIFRHWLNQRCYELRPDRIIFEAPYVPRPGSSMPMNVTTLRRLLGFAATIEATAWELRIPCYETTPLEVAKFFLGTARLKRDEKKLRTVEMCHHYGWPVEDDNAADALAIWAQAECAVAPEATCRRGSGPLFIPPSVEAPPVLSDQGRSLFGGNDNVRSEP